MSNEQNEVIGNASNIIDQFGGIRPMSTKTGIPVTTIQGWKQRNAIPANRRNELIDAANKYGIMLGDLLIDIAGEKNTIEEMTPEDEKALQRQKMKAANQDPELRPAGNQATLLAAGALILTAAIAGVFFAMAPKIGAVTEQDSRIQELEQQIVMMKDAQKAVLEEQAEKAAQIAAEKLANQVQNVPDSITSQLSSLENKYSSIANDLKTGNVNQRLAKIENHVNSLKQNTRSLSLQDLVLKLENMQSSEGGISQIQGLMTAFLGASQTTQDADMTSVFASLKQNNPQIAETFKDVASEDMKAAVMLLGMTQLRDSMARDNMSFDKDLQILKATVAKDNPELLAAIDRLAPRAKAGILTPTGLSKELRGLTGDIVSASLTGTDISIEDRAKARFGELVKIEKNGQRVSGNSTQIMITEAQKKLDKGDVAGAVTLLQNLQGPAAQKAQPVIDAAQATIMAKQVQQMIGQNLVQSLKNMGHKSPSYTIGGGGLDQILNQVKSIGAGALQ